MTDLQLASLILTAEFALVSWVLLFIFLRRQRQRQEEDHAHAGAVRQHIEARELSHREALTRLFETTYGIQGEELSAKVEEYLERERAFYNVMLNLYLNRDGAKLKQIPEELAKVVKPWAELTPVGMVSAEALSNLESENSRLVSELEQTKETLEQLMQEYLAAFKKGAAPPEPDPEAPPEPPTPEPAALDLDDIDVDLEPAVAAIQPPTPAPEPEPSPAAAEEPAPAPEPAEEHIDPEDIDAMLRALAEEMTGNKPPEPSPAPPATEEIALDPEEIAEARAREELEGLADLFDTDSESK